MNIINVKRNRIGKINWDDIRAELKNYSGKFYIQKETNETIYFDEKFVAEYTGSESTKNAKKTVKKLKTNLIDNLQEVIEKATNILHEDNKEDKHIKDAKYGWDKYLLGFDYHTIDDSNNEKIVGYEGTVVIRCDSDNKKYLYDIVGIKKRGM